MLGSTQYVLRVRQPDGSWEYDMENPMSKQEAVRTAKLNRIIGGVLCQIWTEKEALQMINAREKS